jgi:hypothetical protein
VSGRSATLAALAVASVAAGAIHAVAAPGHLAEDPLLGAAFVSVAIFQVTWAIAVTRGGDERVVAIGATVNAAIVLAWIASRTVGLPLGPHAWSPEAPRVLDLTATLLELVIVAGSAATAGDPPREAGSRHPRHRPRHGLRSMTLWDDPSVRSPHDIPPVRS